MKSIILHLVIKDLARDFKNPTGLIIMLILPVMVALLVASTFSSNNQEGTPNITIHIAVLDLDDNFLGRSILGMSNQRQDGGNIVIHQVESKEEGLLKLENRRASAFLILPENLTEDVLDSATATIQIYKNPAEQMMPEMVEKGIDIFATGVSQVVVLLGDELKVIRGMVEEDEFPDTWTAAMLVYKSMNKLESLETYFFPFLVQMDTVDAKDFIPSASKTISSGGES